MSISTRSELEVARTERLRIRRWQPDDLDRLLPILGDATTMRFWPRPLTRDEVERWIARSLAAYEEHGIGRYAVSLAETPAEIIGDVGVLPAEMNGEPVWDLGWIVHHPFHGRGLASEAARAVAEHAFAHPKIGTLHANMPTDHLPSIRVAEQIGMRRVRQFNNPRNRDLPTFLYALDRAG